MSSAGRGQAVWHRCSSCRGPIPYGATWWRCSVSTCNRPRTALRFCSVSCWDAHLSLVRHRESWAVEERAPANAGAAQEQEPPSRSRAGRAARPAEPAPRPPRRSASAPEAAPRTPPESRPPAGGSASPPIEILVVASRLKHYVRARAGMQTSDKVLMPLSDHLRALVDEAIERARADGRGTLLARDIAPPRR